MAPPFPYPLSPPASISRSRTTPEAREAAAEALLRSSTSHNGALNPPLTPSFNRLDNPGATPRGSMSRSYTSPDCHTPSSNPSPAARVRASMSRSHTSPDGHTPLLNPSPTASLRGSISRSHTSPEDVRSLSEALMRTSVTKTHSSSSTATTLTGYVTTPRSERSTHRSSSKASTSSGTRERLRALEAEHSDMRKAMEVERSNASKMRRAAEEERVIAERLKREGTSPELSAKDAALRVDELKREVLSTGFRTAPRSTDGLFKAVCSTDLLFLIDTTGSMAGHINAAKEQVNSIVKDIRKAFLGEADVRVAVVGYKDHADWPNVQFLDFTEDADRVRAFLASLTASGGGDAPEDVLGGLSQALNASWSQQTRCIIHIADAPPHGHVLQNHPESDDYPIAGTEPHRLTHGPLLKQMIELSINYALLRINNSTDKMVYTFLQAYSAASADCKLHISNMYYSLAHELSESRFGGGISGHKAKTGLHFEEAKLGTAFSALRRLVVKAVTTSASRTAVRMSRLTSRKGIGFDKRLFETGLMAIKEDEDDAEDFRLETIPPQWNLPAWFNETLNVEGFCPDGVVHHSRTLNNMMANDNNILMSVVELTIHKRSRPFAQGAMRIASYAKTAASTDQFVVKSFKKKGKRLAHLAEDMRCQALCKAFALEFNALLGDENSIDFVVSTCLKGKSGIGSDEECLSLEPYIRGTYVKYNNNCGFVNEDNPHDRFNEAAQAFSHFTFERSRGAFLVSDLQGVNHRLTDPTIHTLDPERFKLSDGNLGISGFKFFFATHMCNRICTTLRLMSNKVMIESNSLRFRDSWPSMENTVCCSNKMCGKIIRMASARRSDNFLGYYWCGSCFAQLQSSLVKWICIEPGPHHEFEVSKFFSESQGQRVSRKCPKHREKEVAMPSTVMVNSSHWAKMKSATRKKSTFERTW
jgi:hypothetical protein